jgi:adenylylsulfate kinase
MVIWIIGLSGVGKTTLGRQLYEKLKIKTPNLVYLDGDDLRKVWNDEKDYSLEARKYNAARISNLCKLLDSQDIHVVASVLSIFPEWQKWNREKLSNYYQVYLTVPLDILKERDSKGLYNQENPKNVVGIDIDFPEPYMSDLTLESYGENSSPKKLLEKVHSSIQL